MSKVKILVVEDEKAVGNFLAAILTDQKYQVIHASNGREALTMSTSHRPELILLDLGLPDIDGVDVLRNVRGWSDMPVIVVSARQEEEQKVACLDAGANDYVTKPFGNSELLARIRTSLRQHERMSGGNGFGDSKFSAAGLVIDHDKRKVTVSGKTVHLTPMEYKIIVLLSRHSGRVLTHDFILREIWGPLVSDSQLLRVNMANIRRKIESDPADPKYILTEVGVGYRMIDADNDIVS